MFAKFHDALYFRLQRFPLVGERCAGNYLYLVAYGERAGNHGASQYGAAQRFVISARLISVKAARYVKYRFVLLAFRRGDVRFYGFYQEVYVYAVRRAYRYDRRVFSHRAFDEFLYFFVAFVCSLLRNEVDLVLHDYDIFYAGYIQRLKVLSRLRLRAFFVCRYEKQSAVHQSGAG